MANPFLNFIRRRSRQEWIEFYRDRLLKVRIYAQENGEKAAIVALFFGIGLVIFFKLFVLIACLIALWILTVLVLSESSTD